MNPNSWSSGTGIVVISYSTDSAWGSTNNPNGGNVFAGLQGQGNYIQQNLTGVPNSYFYLEFDESYRYYGFAPPTSMEVLCNGIVVLSYAPTASWQTMKTNVCTTDSSGKCTIKFLNAQSLGDCTGFIDNIKVIQTPSIITAEIQSCQMWLDGADHSQVQLSTGSLVSTWNDKTGNGNHATQSNTASQPTYSSNGGMVMNGSHWFTTPISAVASTESLFIVFETSNSIVGELFAGTTTYTRELLILDGTIYINNWGTSNFRNSFYTTFGGTCPLNSKTIIDYQYHQSITINKNGFLTGSGISLSFGAGSGTSNIGSSNHMANNLNGVIYEVIYYNTFLGLADTQKVEGYLAWKWNLQSSLPSSHPYKSFPPFIIEKPTKPSLSTTPTLSPTTPTLSPTSPSLSPTTLPAPQPTSPQPSLSIHHPKHPTSSSKKPSQNTKKRYQWWQGAKRYVGYKYQKSD